MFAFFSSYRSVFIDWLFVKQESWETYQEINVLWVPAQTPMAENNAASLLFYPVKR